MATALNTYGNTGLIIESPGEVVTDLYGLETCTAVFKIAANADNLNSKLSLVPPMFSYHPIFSWLNIERRRIGISPGYLVVTAEFAGISGSTVPIYELDLGLSEEPIETHPKFVTDIAGTASAPLHGAIFVDEGTGRITSDNAHAVFSRFQSVISGDRNEFAGISAYLDFSNAVWRKTQLQTFQPTDMTLLGTIQFPAGPAPGLGFGQNWVYAGLTFIQRGLVYAVKQEWRASGRRGWNTTIYGP
jgi:hypothetical protein